MNPQGAYLSSENYVALENDREEPGYGFGLKFGHCLMAYMAMQDFIDEGAVNCLLKGTGDDQHLYAVDEEEAQLILDSLEKHLTVYKAEIEASHKDMEARAEKELKLHNEDFSDTAATADSNPQTLNGDHLVD